MPVPPIHVCSFERYGKNNSLTEMREPWREYCEFAFVQSQIYSKR